MTMRFFSILALMIAFVSASPVLAADPEAGAAVFRKCRACHMIGESAHNAVGPSLNGVAGRKAGMADGYNYSDANKGSGLVWDEATFKSYIANPQAKIPGTKMIFPGVSSEKDRDDLWAFVSQYKTDGLK